MSATLDANSLYQGVIGQIQGPFEQNQFFDFNNKIIKLGIFIAEKDLMTFLGDNQNMQGFPVDINGERVIIYKKGMYEPNVPLSLARVSFPQGAPASVFIDYVVLDI